MNDAAKDVEIEDVLASIRRLVSEEAERATTTSTLDVSVDPDAVTAPTPSDRADDGFKLFRPSAHKSTTDQKSPASVGAEALVLTPALRVDALEPDAVAGLASEEGDTSDGVEPVDLTAYAAPQPADEAEQDTAAQSPDMPQLPSDPDEEEQADNTPESNSEAVPHVLSAVPDLSAKRDAPEADGAEDTRSASEDSEAHILNEAMESLDSDPGHAESTADDVSVETAIAPQMNAAEDNEATAAERLALEEKVARLEALVHQSGDDFEPEEAAARPSLAWEDVNTAAPTATAAEPEPEDMVASAEQETWQSETALTPEQLDGLKTGVSAVTPATAENASGPDRSPAEAVVPTQLGDVGHELVLDEDALRDLVAALVREELRGPLGEKITRNMRNLVRREVHRALASRELD